MLDRLTEKELCVLQSMLYEATEEAYKMAELGRGDRGWFSRYQGVHAEVGQLFIDTALVLIDRLNHDREAQPA